MTAGRPSSHTSDLAGAICERLSQGESLRKICSGEDMPSKSTVMRWLAGNEEFRGQYARARDAQADYYAEEILEISDDGSHDTYETEDGRTVVNSEVVQRSRLRVDSRKWLASKLAPKKYGDKVMAELSGADGGPIILWGAKPERVIVDSAETET